MACRRRAESAFRPVARASHVLLAAVMLALTTATETVAATSEATVAHRLSAPVASSRTFRLGERATHVAVYWHGERTARVRIALSRDGRGFARARPVQLDEVGEGRRNGVTYGALIVAPGVRAARVSTDRPLRRLTVVALTDRLQASLNDIPNDRAAVPRSRRALAAPQASEASATTGSRVPQPRVISRSGWGADESLRFDRNGKEFWPPTFWPIRKLIVHHTATANDDPDPRATIRSIYYYHAVVQGWGDIGYNFLVDEAGNVYEGRFSRQYGAGQAPTGEDESGRGVTGAHAVGYNSGTVGVALLGTLTKRQPSEAAREALERLLAWKAERHAIEAQGASLYTNPVSGSERTFPNISGHRDVGATECPGEAFYPSLPRIRSNVVSLLAQPSPALTLAVRPRSRRVERGGKAAYTVTVSARGGFAGKVSLAARALPTGASATFRPRLVAAPGSATATVRTVRSTPRGTYSLNFVATSGRTTRRARAVLVVR
ncbi:MAG: N-acetylmuramoyl-L-alanine amidase [Actinomycetota bacterium]|nr:N-acetylmuramoyl-L-alanine amidase [Actinomycetota bacterium]